MRFHTPLVTAILTVVALFTPRVVAQTVTYSDGTTDSTPITAGSPTILTVASGHAAQSGRISGGSIIKEGDGTLTLSGDNDFSGALTISAGRLKLGSVGTASSGPLGTIEADTTVTSGAVLDVNGYSLAAAEALTINGTGISSSGALINSSPTAAATYRGTVTLGTANTSLGGDGDLTLTSGLVGDLAFSKVGTGTLALAATSARTSGAATVNAGTLRLGHTSALGTTGASVTLAGGTLDLATDTSVSAYNTTLSSSSTILSNRATAGTGLTHTLGTLTLGGQTLNIRAGTNLAADSAYGVRFGTTTLSGNATFDVANNGLGFGTLTLGPLAGVNTARTITKTGAGTLVFSATPSSAVANGSALVINGGIAQVNTAGTLTSGGSFAVTVNANTADGSAAFNLANVNQTVSSLTFGGTGATSTSVNSVDTGTGTLSLNGGILYHATNNPLGGTLAGNLALGSIARTFTVHDSTNADVDLKISAKITSAGGFTKAGAGTLALTGTASALTEAVNVTGGLLSVQAGGTGTVSKTGVSMNVSGGGKFAVTGSGSSWTTAGRYSMRDATSSLTVSNGGALTTASAELDYGATALITGSGSSWNTNAGGLTLLTASVSVLNGASANVGSLSLGAATLSNVAFFTIGGGSTVTATGIAVGGLGKGTLTVTGGSSLNVGSGTVNLRNGSTLALGDGGTVGTITIGTVINAGTIAFNHSGDLIFGANVSGGYGAITKAGSGTTILTGNASFTGPTTISGGTLQIGNGGTTGYLASSNIFNHGSLVFNRSNAITVGPIGGSGSIAQIGSGTTTFVSNNTHTGGTTVSAGTLLLSSSGTLGADTNALTLTGGTLNLGGLSRQAGTVTLAGGTLTNGTLTGASYDARGGTVSAILAGSAALTKTTDGSLTLSAANTYTGGTLIADGTVRINNSTGSAFGTGAVTVASGATLTGAGSFTGALQNNGTYAPGNSPDLQTLSSFNQGSSGTLVLEIAGLTRGTGYDALDVTGLLTFGGTLQLDFIDGFTGASLTSGATFNFFDWGSATGTFSALSLPDLTAYGLAWNTSALYTSGELSITATASAIPEPSTYAALAGLAALVLVAWRRSRTAA